MFDIGRRAIEYERISSVIDQRSSAIGRYRLPRRRADHVDAVHDLDRKPYRREKAPRVAQ